MYQEEGKYELVLMSDVGEWGENYGEVARSDNPDDLWEVAADMRKLGDDWSDTRWAYRLWAGDTIEDEFVFEE